MIYKQDADETHLSSVFWLNIASGLVMTLAFVAVAPLVASFYEEPLLRPLTIALATNFLILSFGLVQRVIMKKTLNFRPLAIANIVSVSVAGAVAIAMAFTGFGVWSLVANYLVASAVATLLLWKLNSWRPLFSFEWSAVKELLGFSVNFLGDKTVSYWMRNIDNLLIGKVIGSSALGLYSKAYAVLMLPLLNITNTVMQVMFPSLSLIQEDKPRVKRIYLRATQSTALLTFPLFAGVGVTAEPFVLAVFGEQWAGMIPLVQVFCVLGVAESIVRTGGNLFLSQGRADLKFRVDSLAKVLVIAAIVAGLRWGAIGVAVGLTVASLLTFGPRFYFAGRLVDLSVSELLRALSGIFACAALMAALVLGVGELLPGAWPHWVRLAVQVPFGVVAYVALAHAFSMSAYHDVRGLLAERWRTRQQRKSASTPLL